MIICGLLFSIIISSFAQENYKLAQTVELIGTGTLHYDSRKQNLTNADIEGSPYLNDDFIKGTIFTTTKLRYENIPLNYNIYNDNLEFRSPDDQILAMSTPEIVQKAVFGNIEMEYIPFISAKKTKRGFFLTKEEGFATLYARPQLIFKQPTKPTAYKKAEPARFINKPNIYYIRIGQEAALKVVSKKDIISIFPDHKKEIETFIKKNKVKITKEESLKKLVLYYNSL